MRARAGSFVYVPRGMIHTIANPGPDPAKIVVILAPPGYEGFWEKMAQHMTSGSPLDPALVSSFQLTHGWAKKATQHNGCHTSPTHEVSSRLSRLIC